MSKEEIAFSLVHGRGMDGEWWDPLRIELSKRGFQSRALSLPIDEGHFSFTQLAKYIASEERRIHAERIVRVGHSWGGNPILREITEQVVALDFISAVFHRSSVTKPMRNAIPPSRTDRNSMGYAMLHESPELYNDWEFLQYYFFNDVDQETQEQIKLGRYSFRPHPDFPLESGIKRIPLVPMRYIKTTADHIVPANIQDIFINAAGIQIVEPLEESKFEGVSC